MIKRFRAPAVGLVDQVVNAGANAGTGLLAYPLVQSATHTGEVVLALSWGYFAIGVTRALIGDPLLAHVSRFDGDRRAELVRSAAMTALAAGLLAAVVCVAGWAVGPGYLSDLLWLAPFLPLVLLHDAGRYTALSARRPQDALMLDLIWVGTQAVAVVAVVLAGQVGTGGPLLACWGLGGVAGATAFLLRERLNPLRGRISRWLAETRHLTGWFTGTALLGNVQVQVVYLVVIDVVSKTALAGLRLAQYGLLMPVVNFTTALIGLLVPRVSRMAGDGNVAGIRRLTAKVLMVTAAGAVVPLLLAPLAGPLLRGLLPDYAYVAPIAYPVACQAAIYLLQIPFTAALRGMQRGGLLFAQYATFTAASVTGVLIGSVVGDLRGAAWGLTAGGAVGLVAMMLAYRRVISGFPAAERPTRSDPVTSVG